VLLLCEQKLVDVDGTISAAREAIKKTLVISALTFHS
jgi:hypothetical protein